MPNCANPEYMNGTIKKNGSIASWEIEHCEDSYVVLRVDIRPKDLGRKVRAQIDIKVESQGRKSLGKAVYFKDDDTVVGYGDTSRGIRFLVPAFDRSKHHSILPNIFFE